MRITFLDLSLFLYVLGALAVSKIEGISLLTNIFLIVLLLALAFSKRNKWLRFSWFQGLSIAILALSFASSFWSYNLNTSLVSSISFTTAVIGGGAIALTLSNECNYNVLVAGLSFLCYTRNDYMNRTSVANQKQVLRRFT
ncbi:hypothetical protein BG32_16290 [Mesotoga sp. HF07.pep.5.2.highcov]|nr:hypothetical protein BG32_16290 [Mesotoga sp. HF07.pep.5.2.highcov]